MLNFTTGNLLEARAQALVNTVNTVGVMGKGIALMFKERFGDNYQQYAAACKAKQVRTGAMFITEPAELDGPRWYQKIKSINAAMKYTEACSSCPRRMYPCE